MSSRVEQRRENGGILEYWNHGIMSCVAAISIMKGHKLTAENQACHYRQSGNDGIPVGRIEESSV